eukprot:CAMPEP_0194259692 /NCGR_PEP_ID=MMETSP0158-20130606/44194_1 /TAXON_ID=33649 /ORGANISM="Thalassionema nitzschioides, Strain L26-B" /LENGTH=38 /DNA_ID= /DNA_START= /DNA_END= /DNA_ORIENTATION=
MTASDKDAMQNEQRKERNNQYKRLHDFIYEIIEIVNLK